MITANNGIQADRLLRVRRWPTHEIRSRIRPARGRHQQYSESGKGKNYEILGGGIPKLIGKKREGRRRRNNNARDQNNGKEQQDNSPAGPHRHHAQLHTNADQIIPFVTELLQVHRP
ncbi:hypothetical protein [Nitratireductor sp. XY-223]|uniref:hypothetical protein n=1 Tax=Nitratireductor sp. XY-223 TaxID=2561926 RepID=UPI0010AA5FAE|nr:hypothetical protein [Nitratireductor sp. XY-223]